MREGVPEQRGIVLDAVRSGGARVGRVERRSCTMEPLSGESGLPPIDKERRMKRLAVLSAITLLAIVTSFATVRQQAVAAGGSTLTRVEDPVVLTGADVPTLNGIAPGDVVAFRYSAGWVQIPVQVDEREVKTFGAIYNNLLPANFGAITSLQYTDTGTFTGADSDPTVDANDEIVFMANDAGGQPPSFSVPAGVMFNSGVQLTVTDPLAPGQTGYVYLYQQDGSLSPGAGQSYVGYTFSLNAGAYKTKYTIGDTHPMLLGNPENSTITSPNYTYHFGDRWQEDQMKINVGGATNVDILDRHKAMFSPGSCIRTEDTFDGYVDTSPIEGAFVANKSGPVRAIRSYVGANSGPLTQRDHIFYARRQDIRTALRVHSIASIYDFFDYSPAASGMTYDNDLNLGGTTIDGVQETLATGPIQWQMVTGAQGTVVQSGSTSTNIPGLAYTSYYYDQAPAAVHQCTGDTSSYGSSGVFVAPPAPGIPCTDPGMNCPNYINTTSVMYYEAPGASVASAQALDGDAKSPLVFTSQLWQDPTGDADADGVLNATDNCPLVPNVAQTNSDASNAALNRAGTDGLGDACDADIDGDGYTDVQETGLGENPATYCIIMRADLDGDHAVSILDLSVAAQSFGKTVPPTPERRSQDGDSTIIILDLARMASVFGQNVSNCP